MTANQAIAELETARAIIDRISRSLSQEPCCDLHLDGTAAILTSVGKRIKMVTEAIDEDELHAASFPEQRLESQS
jgi:hypothetical protein